MRTNPSRKNRSDIEATRLTSFAATLAAGALALGVAVRADAATKTERPRRSRSAR